MMPHGAAEPGRSTTPGTRTFPKGKNPGPVAGQDRQSEGETADPSRMADGRATSWVPSLHPLHEEGTAKAEPCCSSGVCSMGPVFCRRSSSLKCQKPWILLFCLIRQASVPKKRSPDCLGDFTRGSGHILCPGNLGLM